MTLSWQTIVSLAAGIAALIALLGYLFKGYDFVRRQKEQDKVIRSIQNEQALLTMGVLACLKGLKEQGCNGPVTEAINKIEAHLLEQAHKE
ncbi:MAG: branched-chain amino acid ABC transporter permease [Oscillospiraceae bacterium]|nr:branched-chain amino acid ABC transporter permease [Oscillospiraceae bacterium]